MSFFVEGQVEIRVVQIALPDRPLCLHRLFPFDGVEAAGALSVHQCVCRSVIRISSPSGTASKRAVTGCSILAPAKSFADKSH